MRAMTKIAVWMVACGVACGQVACGQATSSKAASSKTASSKTASSKTASSKAGLAAPDGNDARILNYIDHGWDTLSRSMTECASLVDPKVMSAPVLYLPAGMAVPAAVAKVETECKVKVMSLPRPIHGLGDVQTAELPAQGLLYLPHRYVVPGGRFNEMYGWDSYFIVLGLVEDKRVALAQGIVENFFFEIENYGAVLNANRTYYLTRSQPPFLSAMIRAVYDHLTTDAERKAWLKEAYPYAVRDHALWTSGPHQAGTTGLARYFDLNGGPVPEMADDNDYYSNVIKWLLAHPEVKTTYLVDDAAASCDAAASKVCAAAVVNGHRLSRAFYVGDRAMRESGFDTSFRFGPFSGSTVEFAPVCLNSLLAQYEKDLAFFAAKTGRVAEAARWSRAASARVKAMDALLWDEAAGRYADYNYVTAKRSEYDYITSFYPLWAGIASKAQAAAMEKHLADFEHDGGVAMSDAESGTQWDLPYGWAPTNWLTAKGLANYGYKSDADRISKNFSQTVMQNFLADGTIREKYNVVSGSANAAVSTGYKLNSVGFGWTNGVFLEMRELMSAHTTAK